MCPLTVWGLYYIKIGDNECTGAHMYMLFVLISEDFFHMTDSYSKWTFSKVKSNFKSIDNVVNSPTWTHQYMYIKVHYTAWILGIPILIGALYTHCIVVWRTRIINENQHMYNKPFLLMYARHNAKAWNRFGFPSNLISSVNDSVNKIKINTTMETEMCTLIGYSSKEILIYINYIIIFKCLLLYSHY